MIRRFFKMITYLNHLFHLKLTEEFDLNPQENTEDETYFAGRGWEGSGIEELGNSLHYI